MRGLSVFLFAGWLSAQTYVVDANGGGNFTDLPQAIAAVPSGATLRVLFGFYSPFTIQNKSLTIVGVPSAVVVLNGNATIGPLASTESVRISGLQLAGAGNPPSALVVQNCAGQVVWDRSFGAVANTTPVRFDVLNSSNVHLLALNFSSNVGSGISLPLLSIRNSVVEVARSTLVGWLGRGTATLTGGIGIDIAQQSTVSLVSSFVTGGAGGTNLVSGVPAAGGIGVLVSGGSTLTISGMVGATVPPTVTGGRGGESAFPNQGPYGPGGDGLVVQQGSTVRSFGTAFVGGAPGGVGQVPGSATSVDATSLLVHDSNAITPAAFLAGTIQPLQTVEYTLLASAGTPAWMFVSFDFVAVTPPQLGLGMLAVAPTAILGPLTVPASGKLAIPSVVPAFWPQPLLIGAQFVTFDAGRNQLEVSNAFTAVLP